jgi:TIR domain
MAEVFISYPHEAAKDALQLANGLRSKGTDTWCAEDNLTSSDDWQAQIRKAVEQARVVIFVVAPNSQPSPWMQEEQMAALASYWAGDKKMFIPILIGNATPPPFLRPWRALKIERKSDLSKAVNRTFKLMHSHAEPQIKVIKRMKEERNERLQQIENFVIQKQVDELLAAEAAHNGADLGDVRSRLNPKVLKALTVKSQSPKAAGSRKRA